MGGGFKDSGKGFGGGKGYGGGKAPMNQQMGAPPGGQGVLVRPPPGTRPPFDQSYSPPVVPYGDQGYQQGYDGNERLGDEYDPKRQRLGSGPPASNSDSLWPGYGQGSPSDDKSKGGKSFGGKGTGPGGDDGSAGDSWGGKGPDNGGVQHQEQQLYPPTQPKQPMMGQMQPPPPPGMGVSAPGWPPGGGGGANPMFRPQQGQPGQPPPPLLPPPHQLQQGGMPMPVRGLAPQGGAPMQPSLLAGPFVPIFLAPETKDIDPHSSRRDLGKPLAPGPEALDPNKAIAMRFLNANREEQTMMLKDPVVARAILHTLGNQAGGAPAALGGMLGGMPGQPPPPLTPPPQMLPQRPPAWAGRMVLTRSLGKQLNTHATLLHGKVQLVELALRSAAQNGGVLNISHRVPFDELARKSPGAVFVLAAVGMHEQAQYDEYVRYFQAKARAGVARLDEADALYIVPACAETATLFKNLEAVGCPPLPRNMLVGVIAPAPGPTTGLAAAPATKLALPAPAPAPLTALVAGAVAVGNPASAVEEKLDPRGEKPKAEPKKEEPPQAKEENEPKADEGGDDDGPSMSKEALLDLFSNPDLIKSLQEDEAPA